jgi:hypothetical protein
VSPTVQLQDLITEVLDPEAQARDAQAANCRELRLGQRARFALERDLLRLVPRRDRFQPADQSFELTRRKE